MALQDKIVALLNEAVEIVIPKEPAKKKVVILHGRFSPFTAGHRAIVEKMKKESKLPVVVYIVKGAKSSADKEKNPFDAKTQKMLIMKSAKGLVDQVKIAPDGFIPNIIGLARQDGLEPTAFYGGPDRKAAYTAMIKKLDQKELKLNVKFAPINVRIEGISATKVRNALKDNDFETFMKMTKGYDKKIFNELRKKMGVK